MNEFLFVVVPYICLTMFVVGHLWRYRYDKFGWTTRSSQLYENRLLRIGSPLFHFGMLGVVLGHVMGLLLPQDWTDAVGLSHEAYHVIALAGGIPAGIAAVVGLAILVYRRRTVGPVFSATTRNDKMMYVLLVLALLAGIATTLISVFDTSVVNYRTTVSPWFRSIWILQPDIGAMAASSPSFKVHVLFAFALFIACPFTRLIHAFTAPVHYLFRPYIVYRSRDRGRTTGSAPVRRGWDPIGTQDRAPSGAQRPKRQPRQPSSSGRR